MQSRIHAYTSSEPMLKVNAFIVEAPKELVIVDTTLTNSDSKALKQLADSLAKPIAGIILTHGHPDHIAGTYNLTPKADIPIFALASVKKLMEGLKDPDKALVPPEKALQLLSYDIHAEAYPVARAILNKPPNQDAKREALRLLAADAKSAPVFEKLLRDKDETAEIRQISAAALQALKPDKLQENAREILLDDSEHDDIKATSLTALTQFGDEEAVAKDEALKKKVAKISTKGGAKVKRSARHFISKYGK